MLAAALLVAACGQLWTAEEERDYVAARRLTVGKTMVHPEERIRILWKEIARLNEQGVEGDIVECGVWRGGTSMMMAMAQLRSGPTRDVWLYDTFQGMTEPGPEDGSSVVRRYADVKRRNATWHAASVDLVMGHMMMTKYPAGRMHFIKGPVERTLVEPLNRPRRIALLRLDTDWYNSTMLELELLYPLLAPGGIVFIDDYCESHIAGARSATNAWGAKHGLSELVDVSRASPRISRFQCLWWRKPGGGLNSDPRLPFAGTTEAELTPLSQAAFRASKTNFLGALMGGAQPRRSAERPAARRAVPP